PYQIGAITATEAAIRSGRRELLVAMATGTGKTFLTVAQIYRLLESKQFRRILFLVDRKALAAQAVRTFNAFDSPPGPHIHRLRYAARQQVHPGIRILFATVPEGRLRRRRAFRSQTAPERISDRP